MGVPESKLVLGKHSGRHALNKRCQDMGFTLSKPELDVLYQRFTTLADRKKGVLDEEIVALIREGQKADARGRGLRTSMNLNVLVLPGDGIGTEVTREAVRVLRRVAEKWNHTRAPDGRIAGRDRHSQDRHAVPGGDRASSPRRPTPR